MCLCSPQPQLCVSLTLQVCNNEATCTCDPTWAGTDCSMADPPKKPEPTKEGPKGRFPFTSLLTYRHTHAHFTSVSSYATCSLINRSRRKE